MKKVRKRSLFLMAVMASMVFMMSGCSKSAETAKAEEPAIEYPKKAVEFIIPNGAGGGNDTVVRALVPGLERALGVNVLPFNEPTAKGVPAYLKVGNANPDGYKLYFNSQTSIMLQYNTVKDADPELLQPVAQVVEDAAVVFVRTNSEWDNFEDFAADVKERYKNGEKIKMASQGAGQLWHVADEILAKALGVEFHYVDYPKSAASMMTALISEEVDISINGPAEARTFMESGLVKPLVVMGGERFKNLPDVPICAEFGYDVDFPIWRGVFTTHDTDPAILKILSDAVKKATESEEFLTFAESGMAIKYRGYEEFTEFFNKQKEVYAGVMPGIMAEINAQ